MRIRNENDYTFIIVDYVDGLYVNAYISTRPCVNPQMLSTNDLIKFQIEKMEKLERDMEKRENALKYEHLKELTQMQVQKCTTSSVQTVNTQLQIFCF
jgi:hypothetical protein